MQTPSGELPLSARRVNPALDPGGSGKELVGKGFGTVRARLALGSILLKKYL